MLQAQSGRIFQHPVSLGSRQPWIMLECLVRTSIRQDKRSVADFDHMQGVQMQPQMVLG